MNKKFYITLLAICLTAFGLWFVKTKTLTYYWIEPGTDVSKIANIAKTIKDLDNMYKTIEADSKHSNAPFKYNFMVIYGSSTNIHNHFPNDLDTATQIDVGKYDYDGTNELEITQEIVSKIENFYYLAYLHAMNLDWGVPNKDPISVVKTMGKHHMIKISSIQHHFKKMFSGEPYLFRTQKIITEPDKNLIFQEMSNIMDPNTIILEGDGKPITIFTDKVKFNLNTLMYTRSISNHPIFTAEINQNGTSKIITFFPDNIKENTFRLEAPACFENIMVSSNPQKYFNNFCGLNDDSNFINKRYRVTRKHIMALDNEKNVYFRTMKMYKRLLQSAEIIKPYIGDEKSSEIINYSADYLNNRDVQLLNEYENICNSLKEISKSEGFQLLKQQNKLKNLHSTLLSVIEEMEQRGNISKKSISIYKDFANKEFLEYINTDFNNENYKTYKNEFLGKNNSIIEETLLSDYKTFIKDINKLNSHISYIEQFTKDLGIHKIEYFWLNFKTMNIIKDDFTKNITDIDSFIKENNLVNIEYKIAPLPENINSKTITNTYIRYNPTPNENKNYKNFIDSYINEKNKNYKLKRETIFLR